MYRIPIFAMNYDAGLPAAALQARDTERASERGRGKGRPRGGGLPLFVYGLRIIMGLIILAAFSSPSLRCRRVTRVIG